MKISRQVVHRLAPTIAVSLAVALAAAPTATADPDDRPWLDTALAPEVRAELLVDAMTLEEKSALLYGYGTKVVGDQSWQVYVKGNERLGVPDMVQGDGPAGLYYGSPVTQFPNSSGLAATFSRDVAERYGAELGAQARAMGYGVLHGPNVDVLRDPRHGRAHESYGEDPYLVGETAKSYVEGVQSNRIMADAKHFALNTVEKDRFTVDARVDERTERELYLAPFQDVVQDAGVGMVMCAYTKINGTQACDDEELIGGVLRDEWGFDGVVRTDAGAEHRLESLLYGLDQEFRSEDQFGQVLIDAVRAGEFPESAVDAVVERVMRTMMEFHIFDDPPQRTGADLVRGAATAQAVAEDAVVLLRNDDDLLPLDPQGPASIAVIGASADDTLTGGGPTTPVTTGKDTVVSAISARVPDARVVHEDGTDPVRTVALSPGLPPVPSGALSTSAGERGAAASYRDADGQELLARTDECLCVAPASQFASTVASVQALPPGTARAVWEATLTAEADGEHAFDVVTGGAARVYLDGELVLEAGAGAAAEDPVMATVDLRRGDHALRVEYDAAGASPGSRLKLGYRAPEGALDARMRAAVDAATAADVAVVVARDLETEGEDRPDLRLPNDQDRLIEAVTEANPDTVVVLTTGSAVETPWDDRAGALLEAWYGGTRGGAAIAAVLFGDENPSGRLPVSFPETLEDLPTSEPELWPGVDRVQRFEEGLATGYRHFAQDSTADAAYPFGFGLSYTDFELSDMRVDRESFAAGAAGADKTLKGREGVTATATVTNTGDRAGAVVPQLYVEHPAAAEVPAPVLRGFDRVELQPGESADVEMVLDQRSFSTFDEVAGVWTVTPGTYRLHLGQSSVDRALAADVEVTEPGARELRAELDDLRASGDVTGAVGRVLDRHLAAAVRAEERGREAVAVRHVELFLARLDDVPGRSTVSTAAEAQLRRSAEALVRRWTS